jgi:hypothetical protein
MKTRAGKAVETFNTFHLVLSAACIAELSTSQGRNLPDQERQPRYSVEMYLYVYLYFLFYLICFLF